MKIGISGAVALLFLTCAPSALADSVFCNSNGSAYLVDSDASGAVLVSFTGPCAGGTWLIPVVIVQPGESTEGEADWHANRFNRGVYDLLRQVPDRPLRWSAPSKSMAAAIAAAKPGPDLRLKTTRIPAHVVGMLAAPASTS